MCNLMTGQTAYDDMRQVLGRCDERQLFNPMSLCSNGFRVVRGVVRLDQRAGCALGRRGNDGECAR